MLHRMAAMWDFTMRLDHKCGGAFLIQATSRPALSACLMEAQELGLLKAPVDHSAPPGPGLVLMALPQADVPCCMLHIDRF